MRDNTTKYLNIVQKGRHVILEKNMPKDEYDKMVNEIINKHPFLVASINSLVNQIRNQVCKCDPIILLNRLEVDFLFRSINIPAESLIPHENIVRRIAIGYVQSILVSSPIAGPIGDVDDVYDELIANVDALLDKIHLFYLSFYLLHKNELYEWDQERFEAQFYFLVAGNRYQYFEEEYYSKLLATHNDIFLRLFNITSEDVVSGICKLNYSLSQERLVDFKEMYKSFISWELCDVKNFFGIEYNDVLTVTGWPENFVKELSFELGDCDNFFNDGDYAGWPVVDLPIHRRPFIGANGRYYCFDIYNFLDKFYRVLQKTVCRLDHLYSWNENQKKASEQMVADIFSEILPGCEVHENNYYPKGLSRKQLCENDVLIIYYGIMIIIEIKAGSFIYTAPLNDFDNYIKSLKTLVEEPNQQCQRTYEYVRPCLSTDDVTFYDSRGKFDFTIKKDRIKHIYKMSVTLDNITSFAAKADKLTFLKQKTGVISLSIDDLLVYREYFDSPLQFLHFLQYREKATFVEQIALSDEMDHLGLYIHHNDYICECASVDDFDKIQYIGYCDKLDEYFGGLYVKDICLHKPEQEMPSLYRQFLEYLDNSEQEDKVDIAYFLLNFGSEGRKKLCDYIFNVVDRQRQIGHCIPISSVVRNGDGVRYTCFVEQPDIDSYTPDDKNRYVWKLMLHNEEEERFCFTVIFDEKNDIQNMAIRKLHTAGIPVSIRETLKMEGDKRAEQLVKAAENKLGRKIKRNELCPCGSGKKYKKCCGR